MALTTVFQYKYSISTSIKPNKSTFLFLLLYIYVKHNKKYKKGFKVAELDIDPGSILGCCSAYIYQKTYIPPPQYVVQQPARPYKYCRRDSYCIISCQPSSSFIDVFVTFPLSLSLSFIIIIKY